MGAVLQIRAVSAVPCAFYAGVRTVLLWGVLKMEQGYMESVVPEYIKRLQPYKAGKPIWEVQKEFGLDDIVKLASNENSLGPSPKALEAMQKVMAGLHRYPDTAGADLRGALARRYNVKPDNVVLGSGSEGIMSNVMRTFLDTEDEVLSVSGTFVGFSVMAHARSKAPVLVPLNDYRFDLRELEKNITERTKIVYLCNPNNPTGTYFTKTELDDFLENLPKRVLVILDEAYFEFTGDCKDFPDSMWYRNDQVITLRTFSKAYGLAGVRIGYGLAHESLIRELYKVKLPFEPSALAQAAGLGALADEEFLHKTVAMNSAGRDFLYGEFERLGLNYKRTASNFIMLVFESEDRVNRLYDYMLRRGVIIRPLRAFGLPHCMRVTIGTEAECRRCAEVLAEAVGNVK